MASAEKEEASTLDLPYGHFGAAEYDCNERQWIFQRTTPQKYVLKPLSDVERVARPSLIDFEDDQFPTTHDAPSVRRSKQINDLIKAFPETQPASELLPGILQVSEAVEAAALAHEPLQGRLLGYGPIFTESAHVRVAYVLAFPAGPTGSDLKLQVVPKYRFSRPDAPGQDLDIPHFDGDVAVWSGPGSAIQQVRFAQPKEDGRTLLATRYLSCTRIFRPILRARPVRINSSSRLDPALIAEIDVGRTGGASHVDVTFNPFFTRQIALIDQSGAWSVWELPWRHGELKCVSKGTISLLHESIEPVVPDSWAKIDWILGPETVVLVTRHRTRLVDLGDTDTRLRHMIDHESGLLDASIMPVKSTYLAFLTCTHVEVWDIESTSDQPVLAFRHFRNAEDPSLKMSLFSDRQETVVLLQSRLSSTMQVIRLGFGGLGSLRILSDPIELSSVGSYGEDRYYDARDVYMLRLDHSDDDHHDLSTASASDFHPLLRLYSCVTLSRSLAVAHTLLSAHAIDADPELIERPQRKNKARSARFSARQRFVVDDNDDEQGQVELNATKKDIEMATHWTASAVRQRITDRANPSWTMDYSIIAMRIQAVIGPGEQTFGELMDSARDVLDENTELNSIGTLAELMRDEILVQDVDQCTSQVEELANHISGASDSNTFRTVARPLPLAFNHDLKQLLINASLSAIYRSMISSWISPLNQQVQSGTRLAKEQVIRKIALQLTLASQVVRCEPIPETKGPEPPNVPALPDSSPGGSQWDLPLRPIAEITSPRSPASSGLPVFPLTPTTTPSMITSSSMQTISQELNRLSQYTTITRTTPVIGSRAVGSVLSHWQVGDDPDSYDWTVSSRRAARIAEEEEFENADMTEKERARVRRQAERHLRRQRREAAASQAARLQSSQVPTLLSASQPHVPARRFKAEPGSQHSDYYATASSQTQGDSQNQQTTASQVQPGRFGGRPMASSVKKRKRKSGF